ncbi:MAG: preprotein translocase subunit SecE [Verrucomicrobiae bacterium]|nr:preprotein translocase subunit SecE [Verrucomicrobiae bacterium]
MFGKIGKFFSEVRSELHKATWPWDPKEKGFKRYKQLIDSSVVVLIATILLGAFVAFSDFVMVNVMKALTVGFGG